jgi:hypothetical protein
MAMAVTMPMPMSTVTTEMPAASVAANELDCVAARLSGGTQAFLGRRIYGSGLHTHGSGKHQSSPHRERGNYAFNADHCNALLLVFRLSPETRDCL